MSALLDHCWKRINGVNSNYRELLIETILKCQKHEHHTREELEKMSTSMLESISYHIR